MRRWLESASLGALLIAAPIAGSVNAAKLFAIGGLSFAAFLAAPEWAHAEDEDEDDDDDDDDDGDDGDEDIFDDDDGGDGDEPGDDDTGDSDDDGGDGDEPDDDDPGDSDDGGGDSDEPGDDDTGDSDGDDDGAGGDDDGGGEDDDDVGGGGDDDDGAGGGDGGNGDDDDDDGGGGDDGGTGDDDDDAGDDDDGAPAGGGTGGGGSDDDDDDDDDSGAGDDDDGGAGRASASGDDDTGGAGIRGVSPSGEGGFRDPDERGDTRSSGSTLLVDDEGYPVASRDVMALDLGATELSIAIDLGFSVVEATRLPGLETSLHRLRPPADMSLAETADILSAAAPAAPFDYNHLFGLPASDTLGDEGRAAQRVGTAGAGKDAVIAIIDTLVDATHPSLKNQKVTVRDFAGKGKRDIAHGTAVASIIAGNDPDADYIGLVPDAKVFAANVFSVNEEGYPETDTRALIAALDWAAQQKAGVINISIAGPPSDILRSAISRLTARGHIVTAAVGNDGPAAPPVYPAAYDGVVGVTAVDLDGKIYRRAGRGTQVDIAAPGVKILAAQPGGGYGPVTGTSFATPVVSAIIALAHPVPADRHEVAIDALVRRSRDLGQAGTDGTFGAGLVNVAVSEVGE